MGGIAWIFGTATGYAMAELCQWFRMKWWQRALSVAVLPILGPFSMWLLGVRWAEAVWYGLAILIVTAWYHGWRGK